MKNREEKEAKKEEVSRNRSGGTEGIRFQDDRGAVGKAHGPISRVDPRDNDPTC